MSSCEHFLASHGSKNNLLHIIFASYHPPNRGPSGWALVKNNRDFFSRWDKFRGCFSIFLVETDFFFLKKDRKEIENQLFAFVSALDCPGGGQALSSRLYWRLIGWWHQLVSPIITPVVNHGCESGGRSLTTASLQETNVGGKPTESESANFKNSCIGVTLHCHMFRGYFAGHTFSGTSWSFQQW